MKVKNHKEFACFDYTSYKSNNYQLGDIVVNEQREIGIIIQVHSTYDYRTDMFGNCNISEIKKASLEDIKQYRPEILSKI